MDGHVQALARVIALQTGRLDHMSVVMTEQARFLPSWPWAPEAAARVLSLLSLLKPAAVVGENRIRVGRDGDGGYVMIDDFQGIDGAVSLGVGDDVSWDEQIAGSGIDVWQFDPTVAGPPAPHALFHFEPLRAAGEDGEGAVCLETILRTRLAGRNGMKLLKIDIEGDEWAVFNATSQDVLATFKQIVCEFHRLDRLGEEEFAGQVRATLEKLAHTHFVYHVHGNNWECGGPGNPRGFVRLAVCLPDGTECIEISDGAGPPQSAGAGRSVFGDVRLRRGLTEGRCSFLKKRTKRLLLLVLTGRSGTWPDRWVRRRNKSLLLHAGRAPPLLQKGRLFSLAFCSKSAACRRSGSAQRAFG
jgi:hypothetical protein